MCLYMCAITLLHACSVMSGLRVSDVQRISVLGFQGSTRNLDFKETIICVIVFPWLQLAGLSRVSRPASDIPPQDRARRTSAQSTVGRADTQLLGERKAWSRKNNKTEAGFFGSSTPVFSNSPVIPALWSPGLGKEQNGGCQGRLRVWTLRSSAPVTPTCPQGMATEAWEALEEPAK